MTRITLLAMSATLAVASHAAHAGQPVLTAALAPNGATAAPVAVSTAMPAAADKVYPPLPTLAMLPPSSSTDDDEPLATKRTSGSSKKRKARPAVDLRPSAPAVRMVVSDASRTYLHTIDKQLDLALAR